MIHPSVSVIIETLHEVANDLDQGHNEPGYSLCLQWAAFTLMDDRRTLDARRAMLEVARNIDHERPQPDDGAQLRYAASLLLETTR